MQQSNTQSNTVFLDGEHTESFAVVIVGHTIDDVTAVMATPFWENRNPVADVVAGCVQAWCNKYGTGEFEVTLTPIVC